MRTTETTDHLLHGHAVDRTAPIPLAGYLAALICLAAPLSRIAWYDYRVIAVYAGNEPTLVRWFFYLFSGLLLPPVLLWTMRVGRTLKVKRLLVSILLIALLGAALGMLHGNAVVYTVGDSYKWFGFAAAYFVGYALANHGSADSLLRWACWLGVAFAAWRVVMFAYAFPSNFGFVYGTAQDVFLVLTLAALALRAPSLSMGMLLALAVPLVLLGQKRAVLGVLLLILPACVYWIRHAPHARWLVTFVAFGVLAIGALTVSVTDAQQMVSQRMFRRLTETDWQAKVQLEDGRAREARHVLDQIRSAPSYTWLLGQGSGATFSIVDGRTGYPTRRHTIHITPLALYFRYGLPGIMLYFWLVGTIGWRFVNDIVRRRHATDAFYVTSSCYLMASVAISVVIFGLLDDPLAGLCLGYVTSTTTRRRNAGAATTSATTLHDTPTLAPALAGG